MGLCVTADRVLKSLLFSLYLHWQKSGRACVSCGEGICLSQHAKGSSHISTTGLKLPVKLKKMFLTAQMLVWTPQG